MKIIMLVGPHDCGKTTVINLVYNELVPSGREDKIVVPKSQLGSDPRDFECILKHEGKKIAIYSMGDYFNLVFKKAYNGAIPRYKEKGCNILVCACNTDFKSLNRYLENNKNIIRIDKTKGSSDEECKKDIISHI